MHVSVECNVSVIAEICISGVYREKGWVRLEFLFIKLDDLCGENMGTFGDDTFSPVAARENL